MAQIEQMRLAQSMCFREFEDLLRNINYFIANSGEMRCWITERCNGDKERYSLMAYEKYMCHMTTITNVIRKMNVQLAMSPFGRSFRANNEEILKNFCQISGDLLANGLAGGDLGAAGDLVAAQPNNGNELMFETLMSGRCNKLPAHPTETHRCNSSSIVIHEFQYHNGPEVNAKKEETDGAELPKDQSPLFIVADLTSFVVDHEFTAALTYIEDYNHLVFYVAQINDPDLLQLSSMRDLKEIPSGQPPHNKMFGIAVEGDDILRGVLQPNGRILLIDFGEEICIEERRCKLYTIPSRFRIVPAKAIKCKLLRVRLTNGHEEHNPKELVQKLYTNEFKEVKLRVVRKLGRLLHVHLLENTKKSKKANPFANNPFVVPDPEEQYFERNLTSLLQPQRVNCNLGPIHDGCEEVLGPRREEPVKPPSNSGASGDERQPFNASTAAESSDELDPFASSYAAAAHEKPFTPSRVQDIMMEFNGSFNGKGLGDVSLPGDNEITVNVTHIASPTTFYVNLEDTAHSDPLFWRDDEVSLKQREIKDPQLNDMVLAQYIRDDFWYRARVTEVNANSKLFKVFFVDYGNTDYVPLSCLAKCNLSAKEEPFRAYLCRLADIEDNTANDDTLYKLAMETLLVMLDNQRLKVKVLDWVPKKREFAVCIVDSELKGLSDILIESGFAKRKEVSSDLLSFD